MSRQTRRVSGAVVWRDTAEGPEVLLVHRRAEGDWALPKGGARRAESDEQTAAREVEEETGFICELTTELPSASYLDASGVSRTVRYWAAVPMSGEFSPNHEVDEVCWLTPAAAVTRLSEPRERPMVVALAHLVAQAGTSTAGGLHRITRVILLRRAAVVPRACWDGTDDDRPLREEGRGEAEGVRALASLFEIGIVLSSPARRCVQTVTPLAGALGVEVDILDSLVDRDPVAALRVVRSVHRDGAVLCTHESVIRGVLEALTSTDGLVLEDRIRRRRASAWCLEFVDARCVGATYIPSPDITPGLFEDCLVEDAS